MDVLEKNAYKNWLYFVHGVSLLVNDNVSRQDISNAEISLKMFVTGVKEIHGIQELSYNVHLLLHMSKAVLSWGPLWAHSCFIFESSLGQLKKFHHGTKSIPTQILSSYLNKSIVKSAILSLENISDIKVKNFINDMNRGSSLTKKTTIISKLILFGNGKKKKLLRVDEKALLKLIKKENLTEVYAYKRLLYEGKIYTSKSYSKSYIRKDYMIMLSDGCCIEINEILKHEREVFLIGKKMQVKNFQRMNKTLGNLCKNILVVDEEDDDTVDHTSIVAFKPENIICKFLIASVKNYFYLIPSHNFAEQ